MSDHVYNLSTRVTRPMFIGVKILNNDEFEVTYAEPDWLGSEVKSIASLPGRGLLLVGSSTRSFDVKPVGDGSFEDQDYSSPRSANQ